VTADRLDDLVGPECAFSSPAGLDRQLRVHVAPTPPVGRVGGGGPAGGSTSCSATPWVHAAGTVGLVRDPGAAVATDVSEEGEEPRSPPKCSARGPPRRPGTGTRGQIA